MLTARMSRRSFVAGAIALALAPVVGKATPLTPEEACFHWMRFLPDERRAKQIMQHLIDNWDYEEATALPRILMPGPSTRSVLPTDPAWRTMYWQWRVARTLKLNGQLDYIALVGAPEEFSIWAHMAIRYTI